MAVDMELINAVVSLEEEIGQAKRKLKEAKVDYKLDVEDTDEFRALATAQANVKVAKAELDRAIQIDRDLNSQRTEIAEMTTKLKDLREIMSHHLVRYFEETGRRTIKIDQVDDVAREIVIAAKLGRETMDPETVAMQFGVPLGTKQ